MPNTHLKTGKTRDMAEELQSLLDKIHHDGIQKAEAERDRLLTEARKQADEILRQAQAEADKMRQNAENDSAALEKRAESAIRQAARDVMLALKSELKRRLEAIVKDNLDQALTPEFMAGIITELVNGIKDNPEQAGSATLGVMVAPAVLTRLEKHLAASLGRDFAEKVEIFPNAAVGRGLKISTTGKQIFYDLSDAALTEMICAYAGSRVGAILDENNA